MIVDAADSLRAVGGRLGNGPLLPLSGEPAELAARLWTACGMRGPAWRVSPAQAAGLPAGLDGGCWHEVLVCAQVGISPYHALRDLTASGGGLPGPVACLTLGGGGLRGQHGRSWCAEPGNLHLSVAIPCDLDAQACGPSLPMLAAVALCEAVEEMLGPETAARQGLALKWVNDVVLGAGKSGAGVSRDGNPAGGKLGGVLTALRTQGPRVSAYFAGLGLNLVSAPTLAPDPFALPPAALSAVGQAPGLGQAAAAVMARLLARLDDLAGCGPAALVEAYRARSLVLGREVLIWDAGVRERLTHAGDAADPPPPSRRGTVVEIMPDLALLLDGQTEPVRDGCLRLAGEAPPARDGR